MAVAEICHEIDCAKIKWFSQNIVVSCYLLFRILHTAPDPINTRSRYGICDMDIPSKRSKPLAFLLFIQTLPNTFTVKFNNSTVIVTVTTFVLKNQTNKFDLTG